MNLTLWPNARAVGQNVTRFPSEKATQQTHVRETPRIVEEIMVAVQGFESETQPPTDATDSKDNTAKSDEWDPLP